MCPEPLALVGSGQLLLADWACWIVGWMARYEKSLWLTVQSCESVLNFSPPTLHQFHFLFFIRHILDQELLHYWQWCERHHFIVTIVCVSTVLSLQVSLFEWGNSLPLPQNIPVLWTSAAVFAVCSSSPPVLWFQFGVSGLSRMTRSTHEGGQARWISQSQYLPLLRCVWNQKSALTHFNSLTWHTWLTSLI